MTQLTFEVREAFPQELLVQIQGADVLQIEAHAPEDEEAFLPDLGPLFVRAAQAGLFAGELAPPWMAQAAVIAQEVNLAEQRAEWTLRLAGIDPGALGVMWNVLRARSLTQARMITQERRDTPGQPARRLDVNRLKYPLIHRPLPFALEVDPPLRSSRDRAVQIVFQQVPSDSTVDRVLASFGVWTELLLLGGYPEEGTEPSASGVFPDPPFQLDEVTVEQAFPELFMADEAAFNGIVNHALAMHRAGHGISSVLLR
jgi:hypothetical protein